MGKMENKQQDDKFKSNYMNNHNCKQFKHPDSKTEMVEYQGSSVL